MAFDGLLKAFLQLPDIIVALRAENFKDFSAFRKSFHQSLSHQTAHHLIVE